MNKDVLVTNITNKDQNVIIIPTNKSATISPGCGIVIDTYDKNHTYLYKSYQRKGLKVEFVDKDSKPKSLKVNVSDKSKVLEPFSNDVKESIFNDSSADNAISDPVVVNETSNLEDKPKKRSRKSTKSSDNSEKESAISSESGE